MATSYVQRRNEVETYFDRTAAAAWSKLTSDAPVSGIRATVRAGRDLMRSTLLGYLPADLTGCRLLDAGCGTGALAVEAAKRGADVVAIDLSPTLVKLAAERLPASLGKGKVHFEAGDMLDSRHGTFDYVVAMDSVIHYSLADMVQMLGGLAARSRGGLMFTYAPRTPMLALMHAAGQIFPRSDRSPAIVPQNTQKLRAAIADERALSGWRTARDARVATRFYISHAQELIRA